eukprot:s548_g29.t1
MYPKIQSKRPRRGEASFSEAQKGEGERSFERREDEEKGGGETKVFTSEDVDSLIDNAQQAAFEKDGSNAGWRPSYSQAESEFDAKRKDGSDAVNSQEAEMAPDGRAAVEEGSDVRPGSSQQFHRDLQRLIRERLSGSGSSLTVGELGSLVMNALKILEKNPTCRPRSKARKFDLFPLPVRGLHSPGLDSHPFLQALVRCLNSLHSFEDADNGVPDTPAARVVLKRLAAVVEGSHILQERLPEINFTEFFTQRGLDYAGEEVRLAQPIRWKSVEASLPSEAGSLEIQQFCTDGILHLIENIDQTILPPKDQVPMKSPTVMVCEGDWEPLAHGLVKKGLCRVVCQDDLYHIGCQPLLNGLFFGAKGRD